MLALFKKNVIGDFSHPPKSTFGAEKGTASHDVPQVIMFTDSPDHCSVRYFRYSIHPPSTCCPLWR